MAKKRAEDIEVGDVITGWDSPLNLETGTVEDISEYRGLVVLAIRSDDPYWMGMTTNQEVTPDHVAEVEE